MLCLLKCRNDGTLKAPDEDWISPLELENLPDSRPEIDPEHLHGECTVIPLVRPPFPYPKKERKKNNCRFRGLWLGVVRRLTTPRRPLHSDRQVSSSLSAGIFLGYLVGTLWA